MKKINFLISTAIILLCLSFSTISKENVEYVIHTKSFTNLADATAFCDMYGASCYSIDRSLLGFVVTYYSAMPSPGPKTGQGEEGGT